MFCFYTACNFLFFIKENCNILDINTCEKFKNIHFKFNSFVTLIFMAIKRHYKGDYKAVLAVETTTNY